MIILWGSVPKSQDLSHLVQGLVPEKSELWKVVTLSPKLFFLHRGEQLLLFSHSEILTESLRLPLSISLHFQSIAKSSLPYLQHIFHICPFPLIPLPPSRCSAFINLLLDLSKSFWTGLLAPISLFSALASRNHAYFILMLIHSEPAAVHARNPSGSLHSVSDFPTWISSVTTLTLHFSQRVWNSQDLLHFLPVDLLSI